MKICRDYEKVPQDFKKCVVALGNFDGVHKGHQKVINKTFEIAKVLGVKPAIITFEPHPRELFGKMGFLNSGFVPVRIANFRTKMHLLKEEGIEYTLAIRFSEKFFRMKPAQFVSEILKESLDVQHVVVGEDFFFGARRKGSVSTLEKKAKKYGFGFTQVDLVGDSSENPYSSTQIRNAIQLGEVKKVGEILGRNYLIEGRVYSGDRRGKQIGYPTANVKTGRICLPARGVYAVNIEIDGKKYNAVANLGTRPTFLGKEMMLEVHIFGFSQDIYGKRVKVFFIQKIRNEKRFKNSIALRKQISKDCEIAKNMLIQEEIVEAL